MFSKIILSLLTTTLITTSAAFAMDKNEKTSKAMQLRKKIDKKYIPGFNRILAYYEDQVEYHNHMKNYLEKHKNNPKENFLTLFGKDIRPLSKLEF